MRVYRYNCRLSDVKKLIFLLKRMKDIFVCVLECMLNLAKMQNTVLLLSPAKHG